MIRTLVLRRFFALGCASTVLVVACADSDFPDDPGVLPNIDGGSVPDASGGPDTGTPPTPRPDAGKPDAGDGGIPVLGCGNGALDSGESCDDGNQISGDGCTAECALETAGPNDLCQGVDVALAQGEASATTFTGTVTASTAGLFNQYQGTCGGGSGPDAVYRFVPPALGRATVRVTAGFPVVVSARGECDTETTELACGAHTGQGPVGEPIEVGFPVIAQQPIFLFVDGVAGTSGDFTLDIDVDTAVCGNGIGEQPEGCDDGNTADGDGCSATCVLEDAALPGSCPGMGVRMTAAAGAPGIIGFSGDTLNPSAPTSDPTVTGCPARSGSNRIYALTPAVDGNLTVDLLAAYEGALVQVLRACVDNGELASCVGALDPLTPLRASVRVRAEETVYVIVDSGTASTGGLYTLQAKLTADACGDGLIGGNEECDDGNTAGGDGCSAACTVERNADSYACPGQVLALGDGAVPVRVSGATRPAAGETLPVSTFAVSGSGSAAPDVVYRVTSDIDGYATAKLDADFVASLMVKSGCTPGTSNTDRIAFTHTATGMAQRTVQFPIQAGVPLFLVVDGYTATALGSFSLELSTSPRVCGNLRLDGGEQCDDGNVDLLDGCDASCQLEPFPTWGACATAPELTFAVEGGRSVAKVHSGNANLIHTKSDPTRTTSHTLDCNSVGPDAWYRVVAPANGSITAYIPSATFNSVIGIRRACLPDPPLANELACQDTETGVLGGQRATAPVVAGETYWVIVDAHNTGPQRGVFDLEVEFVPAGCGDTILTVDEQCDDGNKSGGDGCSATCQLEALVGIDTCPGHEVALTGVGDAQRRAVVTVDTSPLAAQTGGTCGGAARDGVLRVHSDIGGILDVRASREVTTFTPVIYTREGCGDPASEFKCAQGAAPAISMPIVANHDYFVFVDGIANTSGVAQLDITVTP